MQKHPKFVEAEKRRYENKKNRLLRSGSENEMFVRFPKLAADRGTREKKLMRSGNEPYLIAEQEAKEAALLVNQVDEPTVEIQLPQKVSGRPKKQK